MNNQFRYTAPADEKPLDNLVTDGGYASIFRTVAFVGDSLSSGEFETFDPEKNERHYYDMFEYSWGQFAARMAGFTAYNFSRGGMTASEYCDSYAAAKDWWNPALKAQAYVIALGVNDLINAGQPVGEMSDINPEDPTKNAKTFTGYYARVIQQYKAIQPDAKFFLVTMPHQVMYEANPDKAALADAHFFQEFRLFIGLHLGDFFFDLGGDHQHLGLHTEALTDGVLPLLESGVIDNSRKTIMQTI